MLLKLTLGYWRRVFAAKEGRLLRQVAEYRHAEHVASGGEGYGSRGWMPTARRSLEAAGLGGYWGVTSAAADKAAGERRAIVYDAVDAASDADRRSRMSGMVSAQVYLDIKEWGINTEPYSFSSGEVGRLGQHVPERYLDDRRCLKGTRLKLLCRLNCLPVMDRVGREVTPKWPKESRVCFTCNGGVVEDVHHFLMECPGYHRRREVLLRSVASMIDSSDGNLSPGEFMGKKPQSQALILLGKRFGDPGAENSIDRLVKRFITKAWNQRSGLTHTIDGILGTSYDVYTANAG
jgi:hypothetical protein